MSDGNLFLSLKEVLDTEKNLFYCSSLKENKNALKTFCCAMTVILFCLVVSYEELSCSTLCVLSRLLCNGNTRQSLHNVVWARSIL